MSILSDQSMADPGSMFFGRVVMGDRDVFHSQGTILQKAVSAPYFSGFTYAADPIQAFLFHGTTVGQRTGPRVGTFVTNGSNDMSYGPIGRKLPNEATTVLGILASMMGSTSDDADAGDTPASRGWNRTGAGRNMAETFASGDQMRSLWNAQLGADNHPMASGGAFMGYQRSHPYGINNWDAIGTGTAEQSVQLSKQQIDAMGLEGENKADPRFDAGTSTYITAYAQAASQIAEVVAPSVMITTGIRGLDGMMEVGSPFVPHDTQHGGG